MKTMSCLGIGVAVAAAVRCAAGPAERPEPLWRTEAVLQIAESVLYRPEEQMLYVSCIGKNPREKSGAGYIARVGLDGTVKTLRWAEGLDAPKGSAVSGGRLYVSDIDRLVEIDLADGRVVQRHEAPGARFLNDVAAAGSVLYVSDSSEENSVIYRFAEGRFHVWLSGAEVNRPNGLLILGGRLYFGNSGDGRLKAADLQSGMVETVADFGAMIDGLQPDGRGGWIVSDWKGRTAWIAPDGSVQTLLDTSAAGVNAADLVYISELRLLLIPTFFDHRVSAYRF